MRVPRRCTCGAQDVTYSDEVTYRRDLGLVIVHGAFHCYSYPREPVVKRLLRV